MTQAPTLTDEEREAFKTRMANGRAKAQAKRDAEAEEPAALPDQRIPPRPTRVLNDIDMIEATHGHAEMVMEDIPSEDERIGGMTGYTAPELVRMYKPSPYGHIPVDIPEGNWKMCLAAGYKPTCPDCGATTCGDGPGEQCPNREPRMYRICPVPSCRKPFVDEPMIGEDSAQISAENDPNLIADGTYVTSTPEARTRAMLDTHLLFYHNQQALSLAPHLGPQILQMMRERSTS